MSEVIGRAGFHAQHAKPVSQRGAILHEMMRELDEDSIAYWAERNPNIVVDDEVLNEAMVNAGQGAFRPCTDRQQVLDYGAERVRRVKRKFREDKPDPATGKMRGGTVTTSLLVAHLPKSMCVQVPDFYPVLDTQTGEPVLGLDGQPMMRSRWVARDRDEARRYFEDVITYLSSVAIPGGLEAVLGYDIQHSESTPHVQIIADTFAPDPKDPDALRVESSQAWLSHREVRDEHGKQKSGKAKLREYHAGLKEHLIVCGYDVSPDFDEERHLVGTGKEEYSRTMDAKLVLEERQDRVIADDMKLDEWDADVRKRHLELEDEAERLHAEWSKLPQLRQKVAEDARTEGLAQAQATIERESATKIAEILEPARRRAARLRQEAENENARARDEAERYAAEAKQQQDQLMAQARENLPALFDEFLDKPTKSGAPLRQAFDRFVDRRLQEFEAQYGVTGRLDLEAGDREAFIADGGERMAAEVQQLLRQRSYGG